MIPSFFITPHNPSGAFKQRELTSVGIKVLVPGGRLVDSNALGTSRELLSGHVAVDLTSAELNLGLVGMK